MQDSARGHLAAVTLDTLEVSSAATMKALRLDAKWDPKPGCTPALHKEENPLALVASQAWRSPSLSFRDIPVPHIGSHDVLIRVRACGVCGSDTHCLETDGAGFVLFSGMARLPVTLGHEFAGEVAKVGTQVRHLKVGDPVAAESCMWCGVCASCRSGHVNQCKAIDLLGFSRDGAFAEYVAIDEKHCWKLDSLCDQVGERNAYDAGALIEPIGCAYNGIFIAAGGFYPGSHVAVFGAGPIGLGAIMLARAAGAAKVFAFDPNEPRNKLARALGADFAGSPLNCSPSEVVRELTRGVGVDMLIEAAGAASETIPEMQKCFAPNGKLVFLGRHDTRSVVDFNPLVTGANTIVGARGHAGQGIFPAIIRLIAAGRLDALKMVTATYPFKEAIAAVERSKQRRDGKILVRMP